MVGPLDPDHDGQAQFFSGAPALAVQDVLLQQREERLHRRVIASSADAAHRACHLVMLEVVRRSIEPGQYTSIKFTEHLGLEGIKPSVGSIGDAYDNALMETVNGLYKAECIRTTIFHGGPYRTIADVVRHHRVDRLVKPAAPARHP